MKINNCNNWLDFLQRAHNLLLKGQSFDQYLPHIQLIVEPSFDNSFHLQIEINEEIIKWKKTIWLRLIDAQKFYDPIENLKYVGQSIEPTMIYKSGTLELNHILPIINFAKSISVTPRFESSREIILDGVYYTLVIGVENIQLTFKWHQLPNEWKEIEKLTNMLTELNNRL